MSAATFSIVTPTFNRGRLLGEALASVARQAWPGLEHLVIDGGSTDATAAVVARFPHARLLSEPDRGIYDAVNKGLRLARGEIVGILNSDDLYADGALAAVEAAFRDPHVEVVSGAAEVFCGEGAGRTVLRRYSGPDALALTVRQLTFGVPVINARFFRRTLLERVGPLNLDYPIAADREFLLRLARLEPRTSVLDRLVYSYREHDDSLTLRAQVPAAVRYRAEHLQIAERALKDTTHSAAAHRVFADWHRHESAMLALGLAREGRLSAAAQAALRGWLRSARWPGTLLGCLATALRHRLDA